MNIFSLLRNREWNVNLEGGIIVSIQEHIGGVMSLHVARQTEFGYFLTDGTEDVLLHKNEVNR